jgi:hypothetical protein
MSGCKKFVIGPATNPKIRKNKIEGNLNRQASHCAAIPSTTILATSIKTFSFTLCLIYLQ